MISCTFVSFCLGMRSPQHFHLYPGIIPSTRTAASFFVGERAFLQLNTIRFLLPFLHPFIPSELLGFRRNESMSMSQFLFEDILPIIHCNSMQNPNNMLCHV